MAPFFSSFSRTPGWMVINGFYRGRSVGPSAGLSVGGSVRRHSDFDRGLLLFWCGRKLETRIRSSQNLPGTATNCPGRTTLTHRTLRRVALRERTQTDHSSENKRPHIEFTETLNQGARTARPRTKSFHQHTLVLNIPGIRHRIAVAITGAHS